MLMNVLKVLMIVMMILVLHATTKMDHMPVVASLVILEMERLVPVG